MQGVLAALPQVVLTGCSAPEELVDRAEGCQLVVLHCESVGACELRVLAELRRRVPQLRIVAVCESVTGRTAQRAIDGGVDGLVLAEQLEATLAPTLAAVLAGQAAVPRTLRRSVRRPVLSFREKQILAMVVMGFTNAEIGQRLYLAESTVKSHLSSAFTKLGVRSRNEAAALILDPNGSLGMGILAITGGDGAAQVS